MRTTVTLDKELLKQAENLSDIKNRSDLLEAALKALIAHESSMRLARLGGSEPDLQAPPRRRA